MVRKHLAYYLAHLRYDIPAGIVVFLVALPLCLGIALASGAPLLSGVVAGIIGGLVVAWTSGSQLSVSGPAAGLTVIVMQGIEKLGGFEHFLLAVILAGLMQLALGFLKAGTLGAYFPSSVIKGMLSAIGLILITKQLPHAVGYGHDIMGEETYLPQDVQGTFSELLHAMGSISPGATVVSAVAIAIMVLWESRIIRSVPLLAQIPGPLVAIAWAVAFNVSMAGSSWEIAPEHMVQLPDIRGFEDLAGRLVFPDFSRIMDPTVHTLAFTIAVVASIETLLSLEAVDKLDPLKRVAPTNRELKAQGIGNLLAGLLGGLPITAVIVRSSANINAGGRTKVACFVHGLLLLVSVSFLARYFNHVPLAVLAAILLMTGYKLAKPAMVAEMYRKGGGQFIPFAVTVMAILATDLLKGIAIGVACGLYYVIRTNFHAAISLTRHGNHYLLRLRKDVSFLNKALLREQLDQVEPDSELIIDGAYAEFVDHDILETIENFVEAARDDRIVVHLKNLKAAHGQVGRDSKSSGADSKSRQGDAGQVPLYKISG
ncbi:MULTISPECIES: SulP family inorganic anion transporter [Methylococcus]|uniref:SulP family inorganic anion transporter n=1 Tax=Methylococcus capsulatus TaxID=414 RepID=A0ABZ2F2P6_METCP|nr:MULTISPECIES: SulP family inorganic anion transporter [Methylococcus]MDF9391620.1 SulP family inorganic anion transporter [Methylococcus capsulatus]